MAESSIYTGERNDICWPRLWNLICGMLLGVVGAADTPANDILCMVSIGIAHTLSEHFFTDKCRGYFLDLPTSLSFIYIAQQAGKAFFAPSSADLP